MDPMQLSQYFFFEFPSVCNFLATFLQSHSFFSSLLSALWPKTVKYSDCISGEKEDNLPLPSNECPGYDNKTFDGEAPVLDLW